jgi:uncharacterized protein DUF6932
MALAEIEHRFVLTCPNSAKRRHLFQRLEEFIQAFLIAGIACEVWVDGSFLSEKEEPVDLDVTVILDADVAATLTEQQQELMDAASEGKMGNDVDSFAFARLNRSDPNYRDEYLDPAYSWGEQYGLECSEQWLKGFAVLKLRETNVGLRICS